MVYQYKIVRYFSNLCFGDRPLVDKTDKEQLNPYLTSGYQLIPLHRYDKYDSYRGVQRQRGKSPFHPNWTKRPYKSEDQIAHMAKGWNVGVRLRATDLIIDVDPRNFLEGDDPFKRLCEDVGIDPDTYPTVDTGSGGLHVYMTKPEDVSVRDSLSDYEGVEFKTLGRQVVAAGSIHPDAHKRYEWDFLRPDLSEVSPAPALLVNLIRRPASSPSTGGGEHTQEELAKMLYVLDPEDFSTEADWFTLMQACHHATAGDGRVEFIEWSTSDPEYSDDAGIIGRRWDSLHADNDGGARVTYRTLHKILMDAGEESAIPRKPVGDDFDEIGAEEDDLGEVEEHERKGPLERMNDKYWAVMDGSQFKVFWEQEDPQTGDASKGIAPRKKWIKAKLWDFKALLANRKVQSGEKTVPISDAWLEWGGRRTANGVIFDPERDHPGFLNLWTGWGFEPRKNVGGWSYLNELLYEVLCDRDDRVYEYVLNWAAHMVQFPYLPAEVAICFQGGKGVGKSTWGRTLATLAGKHGMQITSSEQLTGRFNDHLRDVILLFADEAVKPYDKDGESRIKGLITEPSIAYEGKGTNVVTGRNMCHVLMASNEHWFIPAGLDGERRFVLQRANNGRVGQHVWFKKLHNQLDDGGYSALLWDLLHRDISGWHPRNDLPTTKALIDQKIHSMGPIQQWWFNLLSDGELPFKTTEDDMMWGLEPVLAFKHDIRDSFDDYCRMNGIRKPGGMGRGVDMMFAKELQALIPDMDVRQRKAKVPMDRVDLKTHSDGRAYCYEIPALLKCRGAMEKLLGATVSW